MPLTEEQRVAAAVEVISAIGGVVKALGKVPSGELYAQVMGYMDIHTYNGIIDTLVRAGLVSKSNHHLLTWIGGK